ncbi:hypothetical protein FNYG_12212 [Fusarium nygamai]|uniref:D-arabinono-1,4-lactone oxidase n=1 Tax=Gibberella nygamai TaxID=42673 RepID=A0A2K0VWQ4_GIBNY|nr:hypothetical protein FNYG_12212 [Fusarium nygamai]
MTLLTNWNDEIQFEVADDHFERPVQVRDVQAIVRRAFEQNQRVTVIGAMHSTTECIVGTGIVISMENMAHVLSVDRDGLTVTPPVVLEYGNFQVGAISGTHANDTAIRRSAQFSSFVLGVKLVTPTGEIMEISETRNAEYLPAIRSNFGMLGVVCEVTVRVFKTQPLHVSFQVSQINMFIDNFAIELQALKEPNDQVSGMLFPTTGKLVWQCRNFLDPTIPRPHSPTAWLDSIESKDIILFRDLFLPLVKAVTALRPSIAMAKLIKSAMVDLPLKIIPHSRYTIDPCDRAVIYTEDNPNFDFYDWVFSEAQWCEMDQASLLSRSRSANMMAIDPLFPDPKDPMWKEFRLAFNKIAMTHGGIPHINKTRDGAVNHFAQAHDPDSIRQFLQIRQHLDPNNLFLNNFFRAMFAGYL